MNKFKRFLWWTGRKLGLVVEVKQPEQVEPVINVEDYMRKVKQIRLQTRQEPVELAQTQPVKKILASKRKGRGRKSQKRLVYRDGQGNLMVSANGGKVQRVTTSQPAMPGRSERIDSRRAFSPIGGRGSIRITPKMPRISNSIR